MFGDQLKSEKGKMSEDWYYIFMPFGNLTKMIFFSSADHYQTRIYVAKYL